MNYDIIKNTIYEISKQNINNSTEEILNINEYKFYKKTTALMIASYFGLNDIVKELIEDKADINAQDINGKSSIFFAIERDNIETLNTLIENKANVNIQDSKGITPLIWASGNGKTEAVKILLKNKADINIKNTYGEKAIIWALSSINSFTIS
ncbi:ankyrin repeat domain-containing protein, partial [Brachyspira catarrhinii]